jgi:hypothetical protein
MFDVCPARCQVTMLSRSQSVIFMGSARNSTPAWGGDVQLGDRVLRWVESCLESRRLVLGNETIVHIVSIMDPKDARCEWDPH